MPVYLLDPRHKYWLHGLIHLDERPAAALHVEVWNPVDDHMMQEQRLRVYFDSTRKESRKVMNIPGGMQQK